MIKSTTYGEYCKNSDNIEGWFSDQAVAVSDILLEHQSNNKVSGHLFEIGAWHGRSAILWLIHAKKNEHTYIVDFEERGPIRENLDRVAKKVNSSYSLTIANSFRFPDDAFISENRRKMRLIHIDGDHSGPGISNDIKISHRMLHPHGIMIVDDFLNSRFPQITEVCMNYLADNKHDLALIACGQNKGFIVSAKFYDFWFDYLNTSLEEELRKRNQEPKIFKGTFSNLPCFGFRT